MSTRTSSVLLAAALASASCGTISGPDWEWQLQPGLIATGEGTPPVDVSDTIAGTGSHTVVVQTWGSGTCIRAAGAEVEYDHLVVAITPIDSVAVRGICTDDLRPHPRDVVINFSSVGTWTVRVLGRSFENGAVFETEVVVTDALNQSDRVGIARAVLHAVLSFDRIAADSNYPVFLLRESRVVTFAARPDGRVTPDESSEHPATSWGTDFDLIVHGTTVRPGPLPPAITGCPAGSGKSPECRPPEPFTRYVMSQPEMASAREARVAVTTTHYRRSDPRPFGIMRAFLVVRSDDGWQVARVDTTGIT